MDDKDKTLAKLEEMLNRQHQHNFDDEEVEVLNRVIHLMRGFDALGSFAGFIQRTITWVGIVVGAFIAVKTGVAEYIISVVKG